MLPLKTRPALLFYQGAATLLSKPLLYFVPGALATDNEERVRETLALLLDEPVLVAAFEGSPQAGLILEEMAAAEGEMLLFVRSGLKRRSSTEPESRLIAQERLIVLSPLSPETQYQANFDTVLQQVAWYASDRVILTAEGGFQGLPSEWLETKPVLALGAPPMPPSISSRGVRSMDATDVLSWIEGFPPVSQPDESTSAVMPRLQAPGTQDSSATDEALTLDNEPLLPPLSPDEILKTLGQGGTVPEVLRRRILKTHQPD
jgi:hypothetical protein